MKKSEKIGMVVGLYPNQYKIEDPRLNKPVCHQKVEDGEITGSMLLQDLDTTQIEKGGSLIFCVEAPYMGVFTKQNDDILRDQDKAAEKALRAEECHNNVA